MIATESMSCRQYLFHSSCISTSQRSAVVPIARKRVAKMFPDTEAQRPVLPPLKVFAREQDVQDVATTETALVDLDQPSSPIFARMLDFGSGKLALGGHRGLGANVWDHTGPTDQPPLFRENTVASFIAAARAGATFIEFDVQVTADGVPVIFHDNFIVVGDESAPSSSMLKELSVSDFKSLAPINSSSDLTSLMGASDDDMMSTAGSWFPMAGDSPPYGNSPAGGSPAGGSPRSINGGKLMRKHNNSRPALPFEPSLQPWEAVQEDHFPTLTEVFASVPHEVGFDIEIKMTTPEDVMCTPPEEIKRVVDATLNAVDSAESMAALAVDTTFPSWMRPRRAIVYSSFDPEVCLEIKSRRPDAVVMFLSGGGAYPHVDPRRTSIAAAIEFASAFGLQGIIIKSVVLQRNMDAVAQAMTKGLRVMTYGLHNNDVEWVRQQKQLGVHGVIVDQVKEIATGFGHGNLEI